MKTKFTFLFLVVGHLCFSQANLSSSLQACYSLNNNAFDPINNFNGIISQATPTVDRFNAPNSAMYFNGASSITLPNNPQLKPANAVSFSIWVKPNLSSGSHIIYTRNNLSFNFEAYQLCVFNGAPVFRINKSSGSNNDIALSTTTVTPGQWYHLVGTIDNTALKLYVNGVLEGNTPASFTGFDYMIGRPVMLGATNEFFDIPFDGTMDNVRFYDRTLNQSEVTMLFQQDPNCQAPALPPVTNFTASAMSICAGQSIILTDLSTNSPTSWNWQFTGPVNSGATVSNPVVSFPVQGNYVASLTTSNSAGPGNTATIAIVVVPNPTIQVSSSANPVCAGSIATLVATGATSFTWWASQQIAPSITVAPLSTTFYTVTGANSGSCSSGASLTQSIMASPTISITTFKKALCYGQTATLTAGGGVLYSWNTTQTSPNIVVTPLNSFTYVVTGVGFNNCTNTASMAISVQECVGISDNVRNNSITLFPNPANFIVNISSQESDIHELVITDLTGKILLSAHPSSKKYTHDISKYPSGIYFVKVVSNNEHKIFKLIKE